MHTMHGCLENDTAEVAHLRLGQCPLWESLPYENLSRNLTNLVKGIDVIILCFTEFI